MSSETAAAPLSASTPPLLFRGLRGITRADLPREVLAGVTLAALAIPFNIGYAQVANLPPVVGLYAAIFPMAVFAIFASSRQLVAGPDAPIAALIGSLLLLLAPADDPRYVQLAYALALMCALVFFAPWAFKLGFLANFLSRAVLIGFVSGLGVEGVAAGVCTSATNGRATRATVPTPPCPSSRASTASARRRCRSFRWGSNAANRSLS